MKRTNIQKIIHDRTNILVFGSMPDFEIQDNQTIDVFDENSISDLKKFVVDNIGHKTYDLVFISGDIKTNMLYARFLSDQDTYVVVDGISEPKNTHIWNTYLQPLILKPVYGVFDPIPHDDHKLATFRKLNVAICSLSIGEEFKRVTQYSLVSKIEYCMKHNYDLIADESIWDPTRPAAWSKIKLLEKYVPQYDYVIWMDSDLFIMNQDYLLEHFVDRHLPIGTSMLVGYDRDRINTGVWFIRNTDFSIQFLRKIYEQEQYIQNGYWEQAAFIDLYEQNVLDSQHHIRTTFHTEFNSYWYNYHWGHFILHFPGCRYIEALEMAMGRYCPVKRFDETDEQYKYRLHWIQYESRKYEDKKIESNFTVM